MGAHPYQTNFTAGEFTPFLDSRVDYQKYANAADRLWNVIVKVTGGVSRRAGTQFVAKARGQGAFQRNGFQKSAFQTTPSRSARLVPFTFNTQEAYVLEFGPKYIRFYRNRQQLLGTGSGTELIVNGAFPTDLSGWTLIQDSGATVIWQGTPLSAQLDTRAAGLAGLYQQVSGLVPGDTYVLNFTVAGASVDLNVGGAVGAGDLVSTRTLNPGLYRSVFVAPTSGVAVVRFQTNVPNVTAQVSVVSLKSAAPLELPTPWTADQLRSLRFAQSADTMYIAHPKVPTQKLLRLSDSLWTLQDVVFTPPPTEEVDIQPVATLTPGAAVGTSITFTASASVFLAADKNRQIKSQGGVAIITTVTSGTQVVADIVAPFLNTNPIPSGLWGMDGSPSADLTLGARLPINAIVSLTTGTVAAFRSTDVGGFVHALDCTFEINAVTNATAATGKIIKTAVGTALTAVSGAWTLERESFSATLGYAETVNFFEQRLYLSKRQTLYGSVSGDFENFGKGPKDDDSVTFPIVNGSNQVDVIRWIKSMKDLLVGTIGTEYRVFGGTENPITGAHILVKPQSEWGSDPEPDAIRAGNAVLFVQRGRRQVREAAFDLSLDGYQSTDIGILSEHLFRAGIVEIARNSSPDSYLLAVLEDGRLAVATYERPENVVAWTQLRPSGWPFTAKYRSVCVIPAKCGTGDEIWTLVERTVAGRVGLYVEVFDGQLNTDCALVYKGTLAATNIVGLSHLEKATVDILATSQSAFQKSAFQQTAFQKVRAIYYTGTVSGGAVTIPVAAVRVEVGLHYESEIKTLPLETQTQQGTAHFRKKRSPTIYVRFYCAHGTGITVEGETVPRLELESADIFDFRKESNLGWDRAQAVTIRQTQPYSMTVLGVARNLLVDDGEAP